MSNIRIGDLVERIIDDHGDFCEGDEGKVVNIRKGGSNVDVRLEDGSVSKGNSPSKLSVIQRTSVDKPEGNKPKMLQRLGNYMKKLLDKDTQVLVKAGFINGDLEPTEEGLDALNSILFFEKKTELVEMAKEMIAEEEEKGKD